LICILLVARADQLYEYNTIPAGFSETVMHTGNIVKEKRRVAITD
jgi:hypothetical protein